MACLCSSQIDNPGIPYKSQLSSCSQQQQHNKWKIYKAFHNNMLPKIECHYNENKKVNNAEY